MPSLSLRRCLVALTLAALITLPSLVHAEGMSIDPDGRATAHVSPGSANAEGDAGMSIDPDGAR